ncbi:MAG TPA: hypothetical protein VGB17_15655 [Pyrinomonadaceae bacterium]|jgi:hypothetical protein
MGLNLVEIVRRSAADKLTHVELDLYLYYCAFRDEGTGISKPRNKDIHRDRGIGYSNISKVKNSLAEKLWIELKGGRRVRPLVGFEIKNSSESHFREKEGTRAPKDSPSKNSPHGYSSSQSDISEGAAEAENSSDGYFSNSKNGSHSQNSSQSHFPPTPPYKDKNSSAINSLQAGQRAGSAGGLPNFRDEYGREPDELCDKAFIEGMKRRAEFTGVSVDTVWLDMDAKAKKPKTCYRFVKWLQREVEKQERGGKRETGERGAAAAGNSAGNRYDPWSSQETG